MRPDAVGGIDRRCARNPGGYKDRMDLPQMTPAFADFFGAAKADLFIDDEQTGERALRQTGGAYLAEAVSESALAWPTHIKADEPLIETFVVDADGGCSGTGSDDALIEAWRPAAEQVASVIFEASAALSIPLTGSGYLTATVTPDDQVTSLAHFDDDLFAPADGAGFVAIVGTLAGPRVATAPVPQPEPSPGAQLVLPEAEIDRFDSGALASHAGEPERIVAFPQFGQLHAGPRITEAHGERMRYLLVFRAATTPR